MDHPPSRMMTAEWVSALALLHPLALLAFAQVVLGRAHGGTRRRAIGIEVGFGRGDHAAVLTHLEHVEALRLTLEHPVLAFELGDHALDRAPGAERFVAADAAEGLFLLEHAGRCGGGAEIELRRQRDDLLRAGRLAQPALYAGVLGETQRRLLRIVA